MRFRVVCGFGEMMASFSPTSALSSVDLPALGRPRIATKPERNGMDALSSSSLLSSNAGFEPRAEPDRQNQLHLPRRFQTKAPGFTSLRDVENQPFHTT